MPLIILNFTLFSSDYVYFRIKIVISFKVKNEALKEKVLFSSEQGFTSGNIKLAAMEGSERVHIITDDSEVQVVRLFNNYYWVLC